MEVFVFDWWWTSHQSLAHKSFRILRICIVSWKGERETLAQTQHGKDKLMWFKSSPEYRALNTIDGEPMVFEWNIFSGFTTLQLCCKVHEFLSKMSVEPEGFTGRIIFMSMFNDISWGSKDNEQECESNARLVSVFAKRFGAGQWSFLGLGSEKKWYSISEDSPQGEWDKMVEKMMVTLAERHNTQSSEPRAHCPEECWKAKAVENCRSTLCRPGNDYNSFSHTHFCKSAQSLRCSRRNVWRRWIPSR